MKFTKMHGLGNDFIVFDGRSDDLLKIDWTTLAPKLCDRNFGIGADGVILVLPATAANYEMRIFNSDGSEPQMCGNGIRCFAKYVYDNSSEKKEVISVMTKAGVIVPVIETDNGRITGIEVDMGEPMLQRSKIPVSGPDAPQVVGETVTVGGKKYTFTAVSMGNPHAVLFVDDVESTDVAGIGSAIEVDALFPEKTNVEFLQIISPTEARMRVWERGVGETLACGTGTCAALVAAVLNKKMERKGTVHLPGGDLEIEWEQDTNHVLMTGPAVTVFQGEVKL